MQRHTLNSFAEIYSFVRQDEAVKFGKPFKRILHLLCRKEMAKTVFIEESSPSVAYQQECQVYDEPDAQGCLRYHFFAVELDEGSIAEKATDYRGYCDVRPDGSLVKALIDDSVIIRPDDTYTHLVCRVTEFVQLPKGQVVQVTGFPHMEKDHGVVMCSQAAVATVVDFWNYRRPGAFQETTPWEISRSVGKTIEELQRNKNPGKKKGLTEPEIQAFFESHKFTCEVKNFWTLDLAERIEGEPSAEIYGFLESGFPVIVIVGTSLDEGVPPEDEDLHALTVVGHTFDKNIWTALADPFYFSAPLSGGGLALPVEEGRDGYYPNLAWIKYFIVQDDNLGPYFFLPREIIPRIVRSIIIPTPFQKISVSAKAAERAAYIALKAFVFATHRPTMEKQILPFITALNSHWMDILIAHHKEWVLRPILELGARIVGNYAGSEFAPQIAAEFPNAHELYWCIEISWPNLYCYEESQMGEIVIDATTKDVKLIKLPGLLLLGKGQRFFAKAEEGPYSHRKPSKERASL